MNASRRNIELRAGGELITITASNGAIDIRLGAAQGTAAAVVTGKPETILQLFTGRFDLPAALAAGVRWEGAPEILRREIAAPSFGTEILMKSMTSGDLQTGSEENGVATERLHQAIPNRAPVPG